MRQVQFFNVPKKRGGVIIQIHGDRVTFKYGDKPERHITTRHFQWLENRGILRVN